MALASAAGALCSILLPLKSNNPLQSPAFTSTESFINDIESNDSQCNPSKIHTNVHPKPRIYNSI
jgi:hypothetical protein